MIGIVLFSLLPSYDSIFEQKKKNDCKGGREKRNGIDIRMTFVINSMESSISIRDDQFIATELGVRSLTFRTVFYHLFLPRELVSLSLTTWHSVV